MTKLAWGAPGTRTYEAGVERGVLYAAGIAGVPWNGLIAVREKLSGGTPNPYYLDGIKYLNLASGEEFEATIDAFSSPREFDQCDGTSSISNGLFVTQQTRKPFGMCYRTKVGNDSVGVDYGYKLHLVYNALAAPTSHDNATLTNTPAPLQLSWSVSTLPIAIPTKKHTAHLIIDSSVAGVTRMTNVENLLYGTTTTAPRLPLPQELITLFA